MTTGQSTEGTTGYGPGQGPGPQAVGVAALNDIVAAGTFGVLAVNRADGPPHLSTVVYSWDPDRRVARISSIGGRAKIRMLRRDARAALHVATGDHVGFAVAHGPVELTEPGEASARELLEMSPGYDDPADERAFLEQMVKDDRLVIRLHVERLYGTVLG